MQIYSDTIPEELVKSNLPSQSLLELLGMKELEGSTHNLRTDWIRDEIISEIETDPEIEKSDDVIVPPKQEKKLKKVLSQRSTKTDQSRTVGNDQSKIVTNDQSKIVAKVQTKIVAKELNRTVVNDQSKIVAKENPKNVTPKDQPKTVVAEHQAPKSAAGPKDQLPQDDSGKNVLNHDEKRGETERQNKKSVYDISSSESEKSDSDNEKENFRPG